MSIEQVGHVPNRETGTTGRADASTRQFQSADEEVVVSDDFPLDVLAGKDWRQYRFNLRLRHSLRQYGEWIMYVNHLVQPGADKVVGRHASISRLPPGFSSSG